MFRCRLEAAASERCPEQVAAAALTRAVFQLLDNDAEPRLRGAAAPLPSLRSAPHKSVVRAEPGVGPLVQQQQPGADGQAGLEKSDSSIAALVTQGQELRRPKH